MSQRREAEFRFASSFRCYLFEFRFHGQLIFSLNRRPCLPLNGAHVAQEQFTLPLTASPCGRLSRPRSTISQYDFHSVVRPPSPCRFVGPYKLSFEPSGSPVFTLIPLIACWRYEPRERRRPLAQLRGLRFRLPLCGIGSATPITIDFGAIFPFTLFRPTTSLSTLRSGRYRTPRKTRFAAARWALPRPPSQATEFNALTRRNPQQIGGRC